MCLAAGSSHRTRRTATPSRKPARKNRLAAGEIGGRLKRSPPELAPDLKRGLPIGRLIMINGQKQKQQHLLAVRTFKKATKLWATNQVERSNWPSARPANLLNRVGSCQCSLKLEMDTPKLLERVRRRVLGVGLVRIIKHGTTDKRRPKTRTQIVCGLWLIITRLKSQLKGLGLEPETCATRAHQIGNNN